MAGFDGAAGPQLLESFRLLDGCNVAEANNIQSIALPCISTGIYDFPHKLATGRTHLLIKATIKSTNNILLLS